MPQEPVFVRRRKRHRRTWLTAPVSVFCRSNRDDVKSHLENPAWALPSVWTSHTVQQGAGLGPRSRSAAPQQGVHGPSAPLGLMARGLSVTEHVWRSVLITEPRNSEHGPPRRRWRPRVHLIWRLRPVPTARCPASRAPRHSSGFTY